MATAGDILKASDRREVRPEPGRVPLTLKIRRFNPEVSADSWWDEFTMQAWETRATSVRRRS
jgi:hypothetical protein